MKKNGFITILDWHYEMPVDNLKELLVFSLIYGFTQDEHSRFYGSLSYIAERIKATRRTAITTLQKLIDKDLIIKETGKAGIESNRYVVNFEKINEILSGSEKITPLKKGSEKISPQVVKKLHGGSEKISPDNNSYNNKDIYRPNRKILFKNSKFLNKDEVINAFMKMKEQDRKQYGGAYIPYYIQVVNEWSDAKDVKRTDRGWFATIKQFIRRDKENGRLMTKLVYNKKFSKNIDRSNSNLL